MYANAVYHRFTQERIQVLKSRVPDAATQLAVLENGPHTSHIVWVAVLLLLLPMFGILAAIAIPAYQDYTLRLQVSEGLVLARALQTDITDAFSATGAWPVDTSTLKSPHPHTGAYVADIAVDHGTITLTYGGRANPQLKDQRLSLRPTLGDHTVYWTCGYATAQGFDPPGGPSGMDLTTIPMRFLPAACRGPSP
jgi:type IV pilus assembly protein PilA